MAFFWGLINRVVWTGREFSSKKLVVNFRD